MAGRNNFLLGFGERLVSPLDPPKHLSSKAHPYTLDEAKKRLLPDAQQTAADLNNLPELACPDDQAVAAVTLHPAYLAKSYFPGALLRDVGLMAVGSRPVKVNPQKRTRGMPQGLCDTMQLYVAGKRESFSAFVEAIPHARENTALGDELIRLETIRAPSAEERLRSIGPGAEEVLLEVVLHARAEQDDDVVLPGFVKYLNHLQLQPQLDQRLYAEGLCFLPLRAPRERAVDVARFSFVRVAREMPRLRQFYPVLKLPTNGGKDGQIVKPFQLPTSAPADPSLRVAIFDGGVRADTPLGRWVRQLDAPSVGKPVAHYTRHGTAVTSALLFGPLVPGATAPVPFCSVDHVRVLDGESELDDQGQLYPILGRIRDHLQQRPYPFVNLSIGPDLPIEDDEVHAWTSVLDAVFEQNGTLATIAVGNRGHESWDEGNARVQPPADCVNGLALGAADSSGIFWRRAEYSCVGPGRRPGVVKPDILAFGGSEAEPFYVASPTGDSGAAICEPQAGTSLAAPTALRMAVGIRTLYGEVLTPLATKALLVHTAECGNADKRECGWGRIPEDLEEIVMCGDNTARIIYQGTLDPSSWRRMQIPIPPDPLPGFVTVTATFCFTAATDPQDSVSYTRSGLDIHFRPNVDKRVKPTDLHPATGEFFQASTYYLSENELRRDAHKWETTLHRTRRMQGRNLKDPVFDVHYNARVGGRNFPSRSRPIRYALVVTVYAPNEPRLYDKIVRRYRTYIEPLQPVVRIPLRARG